MTALPIPADELTEVGVLPIPEDANQAALAAGASDLLRALGELNAEAERLEETRKAEHARVDMRYSPQFDRIARRRAILEGAMGAIIERVDFGKKKSMDVAYGTFGRRAVPEKLVVVHRDTVVEWASKAAPELVRTKVTHDVPHAGLVAWYRQTGELPDGCEYVPAGEALVIKPEL